MSAITIPAAAADLNESSKKQPTDSQEPEATAPDAAPDVAGEPQAEGLSNASHDTPRDAS